MGDMIITKLYDKLKEHGYDVYFPEQHRGECLETYIVIKQAGVASLLNVSSERPLYDIMVYVPKNEYSKLDGLVLDIKKVMRELYPMLMYVEGSQIASYYDESVKGHMVSVTYQGIRKLVSMDI